MYHKYSFHVLLDNDVALKNSTDDLVFVSQDKVFSKNADLIVENTKISEILKI
ncbi:MAG: hypothetical protein IJ258_03275 [Methanobrevibacter sp.]|uniref:hypothetical protein n=1 Tax=Methanobrevibacter sp. TaxID=66852 RepID=UPI0026013D17|nr:hypothetical protein [Methanobrevibacter sp.]MBQ8017108.1 hypothetical protein [Methanobrevibacter sp.]